MHTFDLLKADFSTTQYMTYVLLILTKTGYGSTSYRPILPSVSFWGVTTGHHHSALRFISFFSDTLIRKSSEIFGHHPYE